MERGESVKGRIEALLSSRLSLGRIGVLLKRFGLSWDAWNRLGRIRVIMERLGSVIGCRWISFGPSFGRLRASLERVEGVKGRLRLS